jgi:hypothetical protein
MAVKQININDFWADGYIGCYTKNAGVLVYDGDINFDSSCANNTLHFAGIEITGQITSSNGVYRISCSGYITVVNGIYLPNTHIKTVMDIDCTNGSIIGGAITALNIRASGSIIANTGSIVANSVIDSIYGGINAGQDIIAQQSIISNTNITAGGNITSIDPENSSIISNNDITADGNIKCNVNLICKNHITCLYELIIGGKICSIEGYSIRCGTKSSGTVIYGELVITGIVEPIVDTIVLTTTTSQPYQSIDKGLTWSLQYIPGFDIGTGHHAWQSNKFNYISSFTDNDIFYKIGSNDWINIESPNAKTYPLMMNSTYIGQGNNVLTSCEYLQSKDLGVTWQTVVLDTHANRLTLGIAVSKNSNYIFLASKGNNYLNVSTNGGNTWINKPISGVLNSGWGDVKMSADGKYGLYTTISWYIRLAITKDYGATWTTITCPNIATIRRISDNGQYMSYSVYNGTIYDTLYLSSDYGTTWVNKNFAGYVVVCSDDYEIVLCIKSSDNTLWISTNRLTTYRQISNGAVKVYYMSPYDKNLILMVDQDNIMKRSTDKGITWTTNNFFGTNVPYHMTYINY